MATGANKREKQADKNLQKGLAQLKPTSYTDPFGTFRDGTFTPNLNAYQNQALDDSFSGISAGISALQKPFTVDDYYNNPFYDSTAQMLEAPIQRQYQQDRKALDDNLNARNQIGSSFDAYSRYLQDQGRDYNLNQARLQARSASADAFNQSYQNQLAGLDALMRSLLGQQQYIYQPMNMALAYQNSQAPLQQTAAGLYGNQAQYFYNKKTGLDNIIDIYKATAQAAGQAIGAYAKGGGK